jgi:phage shock protein C
MTQQTSPGYKQLRRPLDDRMVAGVCSGVARYVGVDPVLVRIGFVLIGVVTWGAALLAYPVMMFLMPDEPAPAPPQWRDPSDPAWGQPQTTPPAPPAD